MKPFKIKSTSKHSAECDVLVLRSTSTTRLVFKPLLVDNPREKYASLKGTFIFQKKSINDEWIDLKDLDLSRLRSNEWVKLEIKSEELFFLIKELIALYRIYHKGGIPFGETEYIKVEGGLKELTSLKEDDLKKFFQINKRAGVNLFSRLLNYILSIENPYQVIDKLEKLEVENLQKLNTIIGLTNLKKIVSVWEENSNNPSEEFWQSLFVDNSFILNQIFAFPIILVKGKAYVGGKTVYNTGSNLVDFLFRNKLTKNAVLIEIKTPTTPLIGSKYRDKIYNISNEISGSIIQISNYRQSLNQQYSTLTPEVNEVEVFHPQCVIVAGNVEKELDSTAKIRSFELFRNNLKDIQLITYDELFGKVLNLIELFEEQEEYDVQF